MPDELLQRGDSADFAEIIAHYILKSEERQKGKDTTGTKQGPRLRPPRKR